MEASTSNTFLSDHIIKALCNTLLHSLWQGILLALVTGAIIIFTKKASAAYRYNLLIGAMALFTIGVTVTFIAQLQKLAGSNNSYITNTTATPASSTYANVMRAGGGHAISTKPSSAQIPDDITQLPGTGNITGVVISYFNSHYNLIVLIWFLIICAKSIQMAVGLHSISHLKRKKVFAVSGDWENKLLQLATQLHIKQVIRLMESGIAKVPMVVGHLKPVILIPVGLINSLTTGEVEAILVHELAHIRRRDYLVNLLQSFMEIVFFFNPAVLWLSTLIKTERENCCDDLALQQSSDKMGYIQALVSCEEYRSLIPAHVMAFPGSKNSLLDRVKRMAGNRNHSLNIFEKTVLAVCLVVFGLGISAFTAREHIKKALKSVAAIIHHDVKAGPKAPVKIVNETTLKKQRSFVDSTAALLAQPQRLARAATDTGKQAGLSPLKQLTDKIDSMRGNKGTPGTQLAILAKLDTANFKKFHAIGQQLYRERLVTDTNHLSISLNDRELIVNGVRMPKPVFERISRQFGTGGSYGSSYAPPYGNKYAGSDYANRPDVSKEIAWELIKENLVKDKTYFTYKLSRDEFSIDGIKQPDDLRRRIIDQFFKPDDNFNLGYTFKDPGIYRGYNSGGYNQSSTGYQRQGEAQQRSWLARERKIIDQMQREGLIDNPKELSFTLTDKTFVINGLVQNGGVFERYRHEYVPADAGNNWTWNYTGPGSPPTNVYPSRDWDAYSRQSAAERQRVEAERDKKLVADLMQDGLITDPNNVTFTISNKKLEINGKKQSAELYQKYKGKYVPNDSGGDWSWTYSHH